MGSNNVKTVTSSEHPSLTGKQPPPDLQTFIKGIKKSPP